VYDVSGIIIASAQYNPELRPHSTEQMIPNALLIAAAPDLLEACKNVVWKLSHGGDKGNGFEMNTIDLKDAVVRLCEAAIAKAEGR
jgi:hypothetical protein